MVLYRTMDVLGVLSNIESAEQMLTKTESDYIFQGRVDAAWTSSGNGTWDYKSGSDPRTSLKGQRSCTQLFGSGIWTIRRCNFGCITISMRRRRKRLQVAVSCTSVQSLARYHR